MNLSLTFFVIMNCDLDVRGGYVIPLHFHNDPLPNANHEPQGMRANYIALNISNSFHL